MISDQYKKLTQKEHIKTLTDTYIGSTENRDEDVFVITDEGRIEKQNILYNPGLYKIFDEILVNAYDQHIKLKINQYKLKKEDIVPVTQIKVEIIKGKTIKVYNNGNGVPVMKHPDYDQWLPEFLFGELMTSGNYNMDEEKITGGKNGFGAKLANIFSTKFSVTTVDHINKKKYVQHFSNNMETKSDPIITDTDESPYTEFVFTPDYKIFKTTALSAHMESLFKRRVYDIAGLAKDLSIYYNKKKIKLRNFLDYAKLYVPNCVYVQLDDFWEICAGLSDGFEQVSFVNGVNTNQGGAHVTYIVGTIVKEYIPYFTKKNKTILGGRTVKPQYVKDRLFIFIRSTIINPSFSSQTKEVLTTSSFEKPTIPESFIKKLDTVIGGDLLEYIQRKGDSDIAAKDRKNISTNLKINKLDDANKAGSNQSQLCTLILTEGDSAKSLAISGLSVIGRDYYGVFPLKGKMINARNENISKINANEEIINIKKILGLEHGKIYTNVSELRYGKVMIMADQDVDGSHIKGLFINMIHKLWPELLYLGFVCSLLTPIIKVSKGTEIIRFYSDADYRAWKLNKSGWHVKYYKGLGTSTTAEAKEYFNSLKTGVGKINYTCDPTSEKDIILAFDKSNADMRKKWLSHINEDAHAPITYGTTNDISISDFINRELIYFSNYDNIRSIPNLVDGLKPVQRKIIYAAIKKNLSSGDEIKVAQFVGYVSEHTSYHHGENSLSESIISMAQNHVGTNNINLLHPSGQFGTRLMGGKDAASPRYIFTEYSYYKDKSKVYLPPTIFRSEDNDILDYLDDDGTPIEPKYYVPVVPMILINGAYGIGTGFSTDVPQYNPLDVVANVRRYIAKEPLKDIIPWYRGFKGTITPNETGYDTIGSYTISKNIITITELPIGTWTEKYLESLDTITKIKIVSIRNESTEDAVLIILKCAKFDYTHDDILKILKLITKINTTNMYLFDANINIKKYSSPKEIIKEYCDIRLTYYEKRKEHILTSLKHKLNYLYNKKLFIESIIHDRDILFKTQAEIITFIKSLKLKDYGDDYKYLLEIKALSFSIESVARLTEKYDDQRAIYDAIKGKPINDFWYGDLDEFLKIYTKWITY